MATYTIDMNSFSLSAEPIAAQDGLGVSGPNHQAPDLFAGCPLNLC